MIKVTEKYGIAVDDLQYICGEIYFDKKFEKESLRKKRYFSKIENALADITERMVKDELQEKDFSLEEAVCAIKKHYENMANKMEELAKQLRGELENK